MRGPKNSSTFSPIDINGSYAKTSLIPTNIQVPTCARKKVQINPNQLAFFSTTLIYIKASQM